MLSDWEGADRESADFINNPSEWVDRHFQTQGDSGEALPTSLGGRPPFICLNVDWFVVIDSAMDKLCQQQAVHDMNDT